MECSVIVTYRCNSRCGMCRTWEHPTRPAEELRPDLLRKIPGGIRRLNITGGEPLLREDLRDIVAVLHGKTRRLEISTNGSLTERLEAIAREFPRITVRVSVEGLPALNDRLRGVPGGFDRALRSLLRLKALGVRDIGLAMTISGENCRDLADVYALASGLDVELANAVVHNSFYFHTDANVIADRHEAEAAIAGFISRLLRSPRRSLRRRVKDWFRAYLNLGLLRHVQGLPRPIPCGAGTDTFFVDPWGRVLACNGSPEPMVMGSLARQEFAEIWEGAAAREVRARVRDCRQGCWMTGTAVPAMRRNPAAPLLWVLRNKLRLAAGRPCRLEEPGRAERVPG